AWPQLVEQLIRYFYVRDRPLQEDARSRAEAELLQLSSGDAPQSTGSHLMTFRSAGGAIVHPEQTDPSVVELSPIAFRSVFSRLRAAFAGTGAEHEARWMPEALGSMASNAVNLHVGQISSLLEDAERFYALVVRENIGSEVQLEFVELQRKTPFEKWWS